jgi:hypothetical protein
MTSGHSPGGRDHAGRHGRRGANAPDVRDDRAGSGDMSVREAGRIGGQARSEQLGPAGYAQLGRLGGQARKQQLGSEGYARLGRLGGQRVRDLVEKGRQAEDSAGRGRP